jgi:hypothetical protein
MNPNIVTASNSESGRMKISGLLFLKPVESKYAEKDENRHMMNVIPYIPVTDAIWMMIIFSDWEYAMLPNVPLGEINPVKNSTAVHKTGNAKIPVNALDSDDTILVSMIVPAKIADKVMM